jgi:hypothetical protein
LLAFDPGEGKSKCYVDGDINEWKDNKPIYTQNNAELFIKSDEKYVYLMVQTENFDFNKDTLYIPVDSIFNQGNSSDMQSNSKILVDAHYDSFYYIYAEQLAIIQKEAAYKSDGMGTFNPMYLCLSRGIYLPQDKKEIPLIKYETGMLQYGNGNPENTEYNSLTDFCYKNGNIEIRIPWQLLNVMDPSTKTIMGNFYENNAIEGQKTEGLYFGAGVVKEGEAGNIEIGMGYYFWEPWFIPTFHERLKPSYYIVKDAFDSINKIN